MLHQKGGAHGGGDFANARFQQSDINALQLAGVDFAAADSDGLAVVDFVAQKGNFFFHCANNTDFHRFTRDVWVLAA